MGGNPKWGLGLHRGGGLRGAAGLVAASKWDMATTVPNHTPCPMSSILCDVMQRGGGLRGAAVLVEGKAPVTMEPNLSIVCHHSFYSWLGLCVGGA